MTQLQKPAYNLETRTKTFAERIIFLCKNCPKNIITIPLINQLIRSGTSIGANYSEANGAASKNDFKSKINISKKESRETLYWLELLAKSADDEPTTIESRDLWKEAKELTLIFSKIIISCNK